MWLDLAGPFVGSVLGGAGGAFVAHSLALRLKRIDRYNEKLIEMLAQARAAVALWDEYCDHPERWGDYQLIVNDLQPSLQVFGSKFADRGCTLMMHNEALPLEDDLPKGLEYRARMLARVAEIERQLGFPKVVDLLDVADKKRFG